MTDKDPKDPHNAPDPVNPNQGPAGATGETGARGARGPAGVMPEIRADDIHPEVARRKQVTTIMLVFAIGLLALTVAVFLIVSSFYSTVDNRARDRDLLRQHDIARIANDEQKISTLESENGKITKQVATNQARNVTVLCGFVINLIEQAKHAGQTVDNLASTVTFLKNYGCKVPSGL